MSKQRILTFIVVCNVLLILSPMLFSQATESEVDELKKSAPKVFVDCPSCDLDYIRTEITFVNYVRDRMDADVHILITVQTTGSGGDEYTIAFIGQKDFADTKSTLKYFSKQTDTEDDIRKGLVRILKIGLAPYVGKSPLSDLISVSFQEKVKPTSVVDKWNFWVFNAGFDSYLYGEKTIKSTSIYGSLSANRVTPDLKVRLGISANFNETRYDILDQTYTSSSETRSFDSLVVKSVNDHWSIGASLSAYSSTYNNMKLAVIPSPAIEYNVFRYSESTRRQLRFLYKLSYNFFSYEEETIFDKMSEKLLSHSLTAALDLKERWGSISLTLVGSHYFHDFSKKRLRVYTDLSLRIFKGLSLNLYGSYSAIHDQLSLPKGGASYEEILLRRKELATSYYYYAMIGLNYTFGSVFSNVVNPRFGGSY